MQKENLKTTKINYLPKVNENSSKIERKIYFNNQNSNEV